MAGNGTRNRTQPVLLRTIIIAGTMSACLLTSVQTTHTAQSGINFSANVGSNNPCIILVRNQGTMVSNPQITRLSSRLAGGQSGIADVFAIFPYEVWVGTLPFFTSRPAGGDDNVTFSTTFAGQALNARGVTFAPRPGDQRIRFPSFFGFTRLTVDLEATRPDAFPAGNYTAETTVFCE